ncbi:hypothetical protein OG535_13315 [Kitasatospora sp. NBC_00085]|uniref:hypothetical protein n=1 Tax=Kitasatospora sp. NBC_00085 TaxID=2903566 RepID=UPI00324EC72B
MTTVAYRPDAPDDTVIYFDTRQGGRYISAECQLGAHHGCPGGIRDEGRAVVLVCLCGDTGCACSRHLPGANR